MEAWFCPLSRLVLEIGGEGRIFQYRIVGHHGTGRLGEEKWRFPVRVPAHLAGMIGIVATHTEDAVDWKAPVCTLNFHTRVLFQLKQ